MARAPEALVAQRRQLHWNGWTPLEGGMPEWELVSYVERLHRRHTPRIVRLLEEMRADWMQADDQASGPGADRPGGLAARRVNEQLQGSGVFVYAAHPSQRDDAEEEYDYSGPRWYATCSEAVMKRYKQRGVAPMPQNAMQELLWPALEDRRRPWLTELGWTLVPEASDPQVIHADICSDKAEHPRQCGRGRYHHFAWKLAKSDRCTTHVVPGGFTEGYATWDDYEQWTTVGAPAVIFDSEMLHRGAATRRGAGWTSTLTLQICSGSGWPALKDRVSENLMWYTMPLGWAEGDAVDALVGGIWRRAIVRSRDQQGRYTVVLDGGGGGGDPVVADEVVVALAGLLDTDLRHREGPSDAVAAFGAKAAVEALFDGMWHPAKVDCIHADGTYRVVWAAGGGFTDGLPAASVRANGDTVAEPAPVVPHASAPTTLTEKEAAGRAAEVGKAADADAAPMDPLSCRGGVHRRPDVPADDDAAAAGGGKRRRAGGGGGEGLGLAAGRRAELRSRGVLELPWGLPRAWAWPLFDFVESCFDKFSDLVIKELDCLRDFWAPCAGSHQRHGAFAAAKVTERLSALGLAVYSPGESQEQSAPYRASGPRWYVSVTPAALRAFGVAPPPSADLWELLCGHPADRGGELRARGLGWTLAPPGSDPQALHADIWGVGAHDSANHTRWPHILWKRSSEKMCTTELVPGGFTLGGCSHEDFAAIRQVRAPAVVFDSECLHRGAATGVPAEPAGPLDGWASTLSIELCTASGWAAWDSYGTGGTVKDPSSPLDWRMLRIRHPSAEPPVEAGAGAPPEATEPDSAAAGLPLPPPPWAGAEGLARLRKEQVLWELA